MICRDIDELRRLGKIIEWGNGLSHRFLVAKDGMGYSLTDTTVNAGTSSLLQYKNHLETCYCIEGKGRVIIGKKKYELSPGVMYALSENEAHVLQADTKMRLICVFSPALQGNESHNLNVDGASSY